MRATARSVTSTGRPSDQPAQLGSGHHDSATGAAVLYEGGPERTGGRQRQLGDELQPGQATLTGCGMLDQSGEPVQERNDVRRRQQRQDGAVAEDVDRPMHLQPQRRMIADRPAQACRTAAWQLPAGRYRAPGPAGPLLRLGLPIQTQPPGQPTREVTVSPAHAGLQKPHQEPHRDGVGPYRLAV
jgi:hypothetical protein